MTTISPRTLLPRRIPQPRDDGGKVVTPVRLKATTWLKVQMMADAKQVSASRLNECEVEAFVEEHWSKLSPQVIAALLYARYPRALPWITPRWIESIHRRLTNRKRP